METYIIEITHVYTANRSKNNLFEIFIVFLTERLFGADTGKESGWRIAKLLFTDTSRFLNKRAMKGIDLLITMQDKVLDDIVLFIILHTLSNSRQSKFTFRYLQSKTYSSKTYY